MKTCDLDRLDEGAFKHVPWVALLAKAAARARTLGNLDGSTDRAAIKDRLNAMRRGMDEENFDEALTHVRYAWTDTGAPTPEVAALVQVAKTIPASSESDKCVFLVRALGDFIEQTGQLPLEGSIPDMTSTTESYVELQRLYADRATADHRDVHRRAVMLANAAGLEFAEKYITEEDAKVFCKNCRHAKFIDWRPLTDDYYPNAYTSHLRDTLRESFADSTRAMSVFVFVGLRAADRFRCIHSRMPGVFPCMTTHSAEGDSVERIDTLVRKDGEKVRLLMDEWLCATGIAIDAAQRELVSNVAYEIARYADSQLHPVGAILGGIASQEIIKIITHQYTPMTRRLIFDGINATTQLID
jgi:amyloid beta precursor protein binding protein 1